ncbi:MAG TPA: DinB family protein [Dehalococcoidia bacterium]|nr:DinB family protein [Dehalococcoidia bacterium]
MDISERKAELLQVLDDADRETRDLFAGLADEDLPKRTDESNWTVGQLAGHIAQAPWAKRVVGRLSQNKGAGAPPPFGFLLNLGNWWNVRRFATTSRHELLDTWAGAFREYRRYIESLPDDVLDHGGDVPGRGKMTVADFVRSAPEHTRVHGETIRRALQR